MINASRERLPVQVNHPKSPFLAPFFKPESTVPVAILDTLFNDRAIGYKGQPPDCFLSTAGFAGTT